MNLLLTTPFYSPLVGGSSRLLVDIVEHLQQHDHTVSVLTYTSGSLARDRAFDSRQTYPIYRVGGSNRGRVPIGSLSMLGNATALATKNRYDLLLSGAAYSNAIVAHACAVATRTPFAVYAHGEDVSCVAGSNKASLLLRRALRAARLVMTNSDFTASCVRDLGVPGQRVRRCPPGIEPAPYLWSTSERIEGLRRRLGLEGKRVILTVARLCERKGHDMVVRSLKQVAMHAPNVHYLIVGLGDAAPLLALANAEGVSDRVTIVPYVEDAELPALFALAEAYVMVSRMDSVTHEVEGFGIVYLEAAASGRPAVGARAGGAVDAIEDGVTGLLVDPTQPGEITAALLSLLLDRDRARAMGQAGRERVRRRFHRTDALNRIERLLERAAGSSSPAASSALRSSAASESVDSSP